MKTSDFFQKQTKDQYFAFKYSWLLPFVILHDFSKRYEKTEATEMSKIHLRTIVTIDPLF